MTLQFQKHATRVPIHSDSWPLGYCGRYRPPFKTPHKGTLSSWLRFVVVVRLDLDGRGGQATGALCIERASNLCEDLRNGFRVEAVTLHNRLRDCLHSPYQSQSG